MVVKQKAKRWHRANAGLMGGEADLVGSVGGLDLKADHRRFAGNKGSARWLGGGG